MKLSTLFAGIVLLIAGCSSPTTTADTPKPGESSTTSSIKPIPGLEVPVRTFEVSSSEKSTIELPNGGSIEIPANAFVDQQGKPITGKVEIEWQEYHSLTDILFSGIPMAYDSAGIQGALQSGGMFTIHGTQNNVPIEVAKNKTLEVNLASNHPQKQFNFYRLDEKEGEWTYKTTANAAINPKATVDETPTETDNSKYVTLNMHVAFHKDSFPELNRDEILAWEVEKNQISEKQLQALNLEMSKARITGKSGTNFIVQISNSKANHILVAHPVTFGTKSLSHTNAKKTVQEEAQYVAEFQDLSTQGKLIRSIEIPGFGTYNWDCMYHRDSEDILVDLSIPGEKLNELARYFFIIPEDGIVIPISNKPTLHIPKNETCAVIAISTNNTVHSIPHKQLKQLLEQKVSNRLQKATMSSSKGHLNKPADLADLLTKCV